MKNKDSFLYVKVKQEECIRQLFVHPAVGFGIIGFTACDQTFESAYGRVREAFSFEVDDPGIWYID